jgi:hypothetical protein
MNIYHFGGHIKCLSLDELNSILDSRYGEGVNEFLIAGENKYPCLAVMINGKYATLTFISESEQGLLQSIGGNVGLNLNETTVFYTGTQDQETQVWNEFVITMEKAKDVANEFFITLNLPKCVEWSEQ